MKRNSIALAATSALVLLLLGCGSSGGLLTLDQPIATGDATLTVTKIESAETLKAVDPMEVEYDENGEEIENRETVEPKNDFFLLVTYDLKNNSDKAILVPEPQIRAESGEYFESTMDNLTIDYDTKLRHIGSFAGGDLKAKELRKNITSVYDVPNGELEFGVAKTGYNASSFEEMFKEGLEKGAPDVAWYIVEVPKPKQSLDI